MTIGPAAVAGIVAVVLLAVLWLKIYNGLIGKRNDADNASAGMAAVMSVLMKPGATAFEVTPRAANSSRARWMNRCAWAAARPSRPR